MKKVTINEVAKVAGVSKGTVSAVINGKNTVKQETRDIVLGVMRELNFRPKGMARNFRSTETERSIGLIIKDLNNPFYTGIAMGVKEYANRKGYLVLITSSENKHNYEEKFSRLFSNKDIKGAIIAPVLEKDAEIEHLFKLKRINFPFVLLEKIKGIQANVVGIDNMKSMKEAVKYLIDSGHEKIVHFSGPENASHTIERVEGFKLAFSETSLIFNEKMIERINQNYELSKKETLEYLKRTPEKDLPTAIICFNDLQALGAIAAFEEKGFKIPDDVSIIGNDDIYFSRMHHVPLTTIHAPMRQLGLKAAEVLIDNIESPKIQPVKELVLEAELVIRSSTKALNK